MNKLVEKEKKKVNQLKAGVIISYSSMFLGYAISLIYTPIMLRLLGQSEYGLYSLVLSVVSYLGLLSFGFGSAYMRYYSRYKVSNDQLNIAKLNGMFLIIFSVIGFIALIAGTIMILNIDLVLGGKLTANELVTAKILISIMVFNVAITFPFSIFNSHITANEKYIFQKTLNMIKVVVTPFIMVPVLLLGYKSIGMVVVTTILILIVEISNAIFCFKILKIQFSFRKFDFSLMKEMTIFSSYIFMNMVIDQINWNVDKLILGKIQGTVAVAVYGLAGQLNGYYLSLASSISSVLIPRVNRMVASTNDNKQLTYLLAKVGRLQFMLLSLICIGLIFFGKFFIQMWAGHNYSDSYYIALFLIVPVTIPLIQNLGLEIQKAKNMHKFRSVVYLCIAIVNVCVSIPLGQLYGGVGCAMGTAFSLLLGNGLMMNWYYHKKIGLDMLYFWKQILKFIPSLLPPILFGVLLFMYVDLYNIGWFIVCGTAYFGIFCLSMWYLGMNTYEKELVVKPMSKILKKFTRIPNPNR